MNGINSALVAHPHNTDDVTVWSGKGGELAFYGFDICGRINRSEWISAEEPVDLKDWR